MRMELGPFFFNKHDMGMELPGCPCDYFSFRPTGAESNRRKKQRIPARVSQLCPKPNAHRHHIPCVSVLVFELLSFENSKCVR